MHSASVLGPGSNINMVASDYGFLFDVSQRDVFVHIAGNTDLYFKTPGTSNGSSKNPALHHLPAVVMPLPS